MCWIVRVSTPLQTQEYYRVSNNIRHANRSVDVLHLDLEGHELEALRGAQNTISNFRSRIQKKCP